MDTKTKIKKTLQELQFDFTNFTMTNFLQTVRQTRGREIITIPWETPSNIFGAWVSDDQEAKEYIFYRNNVPEIHQIHIQLHELSHFLLGHPTRQINKKTLTEVAMRKVSLPFEELETLHSSARAYMEAEAESLASLIQKQAILHSRLDLLIRDISAEEKLASFLKNMGV